MPATKIRTIIVDDETGASDILQILLSNQPQIELLAVCNDADTAIKTIVETVPDLVFLDIKMPGKDGFQILEAIKMLSGIEPEIVFTTGYNEYSLKAFDNHAFSYLLKPIDPDKLSEVIDRFAKHHASLLLSKKMPVQIPANKLVFKSTYDGTLFITADEIIYCQADRNYAQLVLGQDKLITLSRNVAYVESQVPAGMFFRAHRSHLINLNYLKCVKNGKCILEKDGVTYQCDITENNEKVLIGLMR